VQVFGVVDIDLMSKCASCFMESSLFISVLRYNNRKPQNDNL
jgi:hypothetical protein